MHILPLKQLPYDLGPHAPGYVCFLSHRVARPWRLRSDNLTYSVSGTLSKSQVALRAPIACPRTCIDTFKLLPSSPAACSRNLSRLDTRAGRHAVLSGIDQITRQSCSRTGPEAAGRRDATSIQTQSTTSAVAPQQSDRMLPGRLARIGSCHSRTTGISPVVGCLVIETGRKMPRAARAYNPIWSRGPSLLIRRPAELAADWHSRVGPTSLTNPPTYPLLGPGYVPAAVCK